ncbi:MAG TPA: DUF2007 domain-containing protein [Longilinea sp.]|nr:DUF2007 domain-containing protein [Longilinea sp.]
MPNGNVVYRADGEFNGKAICALLESFGIPAWTSQESYGRTMGLTVGTLGEVKIYVDEKNVMSAKDILAAYDRGELETPGDESDNPDEEAQP